MTRSKDPQELNTNQDKKVRDRHHRLQHLIPPPLPQEVSIVAIESGIIRVTKGGEGIQTTKIGKNKKSIKNQRNLPRKVQSLCRHRPGDVEVDREIDAEFEG